MIYAKNHPYNFNIKSYDNIKYIYIHVVYNNIYI